MRCVSFPSFLGLRTVFLSFYFSLCLIWGTKEAREALGAAKRGMSGGAGHSR